MNLDGFVFGKCGLELILVGQSGVGKSSLLVRFVDDHFEQASTRPTIECDIKYKQLDVNGVRTTLRLWDTAGSERFRTFSTQHYRNAQVSTLTKFCMKFFSILWVSQV